MKTAGVFCIPGRREDGRDSRWYDMVTRKRVRQPAAIKRAVRRMRSLRSSK